MIYHLLQPRTTSTRAELLSGSTLRHVPHPRRSDGLLDTLLLKNIRKQLADDAT